MKTRTVAVLVAPLVFAAALAAQRGQEELVASRAKKLAKPFVKFAPWHLDYDKARAAAKRDGKWLLAYFTRSYSP